MPSDGMMEASPLSSWGVCGNRLCGGGQKREVTGGGKNDNSPIVSTEVAIDLLTTVRFELPWPL